MWPFFRCCCRLPLFLAALLLLIAAAAAALLLLLLQWAAKLLLLFAAGCSSCSAARAAPSCSAAAAAATAATAAAVAAAADTGQDNSLYRRSALARARTHDRTIGTSQPTTVPARQDLFNQAQPGQRGSILEHSADANPQFGRGSTADRPHTSRLSLSTNCSVTAPRYRGRNYFNNFFLAGSKTEVKKMYKNCLVKLTLQITCQWAGIERYKLSALFELFTSRNG